METGKENLLAYKWDGEDLCFVHLVFKCTPCDQRAFGHVSLCKNKNQPKNKYPHSHLAHLPKTSSALLTEGS